MIRKYTLTSLYIITIVLASYFAFEFAILPNYSSSSNAPKSVKGVLDLSLINIDSLELIPIQGEAEFYWKQLLEPVDFDSGGIKASDFIEIHGIWNHHRTNSEICDGSGYATYRMIVQVNKDGRYAFKFKEFDCAYNVWINGEGPIEIGKVATNKSSMTPSWKRLEFYANSVNKKLELVLQISNFHHRKGGAEDVIIFGNSSSIHQYKQQQISIGYALLGILLIMALYHLVLYIYRPKDNSILLFGLLNLTMALRHVTTGEKLLLEIFPNFNWLAAVRIEYISYMAAVPVFLAFIYSLYPNLIKKLYVHVITWVAGISCLFVLVSPSVWFSYSPIFYQFIAILVAVFILIKLIVALYHKEENSFVIFGGYFFLFLVVINDILYYNKFIGTTLLMHLGLFVMVISQAFVLSKKNSQAFTDVEWMSKELELSNKELENRVQQRTSEILEQKEKIEEQNTELEITAEQLHKANKELIELDLFKEDLINMIVHDLKNPLNVILHRTENDTVRYAGRQMLTLVQNMLDIKKYQNSQMELNISLNSISQTIDNAISQAGFLIKKKRITLTNNTETYGLLPFDTALIERVFINLLSNATKYAPEEGTIQISFELIGGEILFEISNNGPSIPDDKKELIFMPYGQFNAQQSGYAGSTGLGLTFCKMAVEAHGGRMGVKDLKPKGVVFWFTIPVNEKDILFLKDLMPSKNRPNKDEPVISELKSILTDDDYNYLSKYLPNLTSFQIYEVSALNSFIQAMDEDKSVGIYLWLKLFKESIAQVKKEQFLNLLNIDTEKENRI